RYISGHLGLLIAPLRSPDGELLGVLATEGPVDTTHPSSSTCELVELYAEQARLVLGALRDHRVLAERLRMSYAAQGVLHDAAAADDLSSMLGTVAPGLATMMRAGGVWVSTEREAGGPADAASYPGEVLERLGPDVG